MTRMPIFLDGQPVDFPGATLGAVLDVAQQRLSQAGRMLVEITLNGETLIGAALDTRRETPVMGVQVNLESADPHELAEGVLEQVRAALADAREAQKQAADFFQQDQSDKAMAQIGHAIAVWQQVQEAVLHSSQLVRMDLNAKEFEGRPMTDLTNALLTQLKSLRDLIGAGDTVALADSLAYEWPEMTDRWDRMIGEMTGWVRG